MAISAKPAAVRGAASLRRPKSTAAKPQPKAARQPAGQASQKAAASNRRKTSALKGKAKAQASAPRRLHGKTASASAAAGSASAPASAPEVLEDTTATPALEPHERPLAVRRLADGLVGSVVDVTYNTNPPKTYRVRVVGYDSITGWHTVSDKGLGTEGFEDMIDANLMASLGQIRIAPGGKRAPTTPAAEQDEEEDRGFASRTVASAAAAKRPALEQIRFGYEIVGRVIQVKYDDGSTYRVRVKSYAQQTGWHKVDSKGLSSWDGEDFTDTLDVSGMYSAGQVTFLEERASSGATAAGSRASPAGAARGGVQKVPVKGASSSARLFGEEIVGAVLGVTYDASQEVDGETFRLVVTGFDKRRGWHAVKSYGKQGLWEGEDFNDVIDVNGMYAEGRVQIVKNAPTRVFGATARRFGSSAATKQKRRAAGKAAAQRSRPSGGKAAPATPRHGRSSVDLGQEICGHILDLTYEMEDVPRTFRVRVVSFDKAKGWHTVASRGLSQWEGEDFKDTVDLNEMHAQGQVVIVSRSSVFQAEDLDDLAPKSTATVTRAVQIETPRGRGGRFSEHVKAAQPRTGASSSSARAPSKTPAQRAGEDKASLLPDKREFGVEVKGRTIDITYPEGTYRARIVSYNPKTGWHKIDSQGLSTWDGDSFTDVIDLGEMTAAGQVRFAFEASKRNAPSASQNVARGARKKSKAGATDDEDAEVGGADMEEDAPPPRRNFGLELVGRIADAACGVDPLQKIRVCVLNYDERLGRHCVEAYGPSGRAGEKGEEYWLDVDLLHAEGNFTLVDGREELRTDGHALVNQDIDFLSLDNAPESWLKARIVGWWPQDSLPAVATAGSVGVAREAVFVAEAEQGDRWQLTLGDALLAASGGAHRMEESIAPLRRSLFEVFAGSCRLSLAFRLLGVETESYDVLLSSEQEFIKDEGFASRLQEEDPWDIVHFAPPRGGVDRREEEARAFASQALEDADMPTRELHQKANEDSRISARMCEIVAALHSSGRGFCVESSEDAALWNLDLMQQVERLPGVEAISVQLRFQGATRATPTRLLTNRAAWIGPAIIEACAAAEGDAADQGAVGTDEQAESLARYPQSFCDAYAAAVVRGATAEAAAETPASAQGGEAATADAAEEAEAEEPTAVDATADGEAEDAAPDASPDAVADAEADAPAETGEEDNNS